MGEISRSPTTPHEESFSFYSSNLSHVYTYKLDILLAFDHQTSSSKTRLKLSEHGRICLLL